MFNNTGNYVKSGVGITDIGATFNNSGSVIVNAGRLSLNSDNDIDSYSTGSFAIANGATLSFGRNASVTVSRHWTTPDSVARVSCSSTVPTARAPMCG